jgi:virulence-associated protein VagC
MGAYPKPNVRNEEPQLAEIIEIGSRQAVRLPDGFHFEGHEVRVSHTPEGVLLTPIATESQKDFDWKAWAAKLRTYQEELGDFMPEGRNQPPMPAREIFND